MQPADTLRANQSERELEFVLLGWLYSNQLDAGKTIRRSHRLRRFLSTVSLLLDFLERRNTPFTRTRIFLRLSNPCRVVPATFALLAIGDRNFDRYIVGFAGLIKLYLRHDEDIPQIILVALQQFKGIA